MINELNKENLLKKLKENNKSIVIAKTDWCGECIMISPIFDRVSKNKDFKEYSFYQIDVDDFQLWKDDGDDFFKINEVPSIIVFDHDKEIKRITNFMSEEKLIAFIKAK